MKKQKVNVLLLVIVSLIVVYLVLKDDFSNIVNLISTINVGWLIFSMLIVIIYWFFQTFSLSAIVDLDDNKLSFWTLLKSTITCNFFSAITPSATGGQPFQIYFLKKRGMNLGASTNYVVAQSTLYQMALVLFGLGAIILNYYYDFFPSDNIINNLVLVGFAVNLIVIIILIFITFGKKSNKYIVLKIIDFLHRLNIIRHKEKVEEKVGRTIDNFYTSATMLKKNKEIIVKGLIYNFIALSFLYITPLTVAYAFGNYHDLTIVTTLVSSAYVMLIGAFVPIPGGSGGVEYAFAIFFGFYIDGPTLLAMLLIWRFVTYYFAILVGGIVLITDKNGGR